MNDMRKLIEAVQLVESDEHFSTSFVGIDIDDDSVWLSSEDNTIVFTRDQWNEFTALIRGQGL